MVFASGGFLCQNRVTAYSHLGTEFHFRHSRRPKHSGRATTAQSIHSSHRRCADSILLLASHLEVGTPTQCPPLSTSRTNKIRGRQTCAYRTGACPWSRAPQTSPRPQSCPHPWEWPACRNTACTWPLHPCLHDGTWENVIFISRVSPSTQATKLTSSSHPMAGADASRPSLDRYWAPYTAHSVTRRPDQSCTSPPRAAASW